MAMLEVTGFIYIRSDEGVASMNGPITVEEWKGKWPSLPLTLYTSKSIHFPA
jgi:hypothetical protein